MIRRAFGDRIQTHLEMGVGGCQLERPPPEGFSRLPTGLLRPAEKCPSPQLGEVRPFQQKSTCITQLTVGPLRCAHLVT